MQEETTLAPAQTITSVILLPQDFLHSALDRRGRAACCSLSGVLMVGGTEWVGSGLFIPPAYPGGKRPGASWSPALPLRGLWPSPSQVIVDVELLTFPWALLAIVGHSFFLMPHQAVVTLL